MTATRVGVMAVALALGLAIGPAARAEDAPTRTKKGLVPREPAKKDAAKPAGAKDPKKADPKADAKADPKVRMPDGRDPVALAQAWLKLVDDGRWQVTWEVGGQAMRDAVRLAEWVDNLRLARAQYSGTPSRALGEIKDVKDFPGAPPGEYKLVQFKSRFKNREAFELVSLLKTKDGRWEVVGYWIR